MTVIIVIIFFIAIITAFGMLAFRSWELRTGHAVMPEETTIPVLKIPFRQIEKSMLYLTKYIIQTIVLETVRVWFIITTKTKKWLATKWPKQFKKNAGPRAKPSFVNRAVRESRIKIKRIREKVKQEHGEKGEKKVDGIERREM
jgi:predicted small integral membrane protein